MFKFAMFFLVFMIICFATPSLFLMDVIGVDLISGDSGDGISVVDSDHAMLQNTKLDIPKKDTIKLLITADNKVVELPFNDYIIGVLIGEVPATYEFEALKAQAIVARTYTMHKLKYNPAGHDGADMCDDINCCQCYKTKEYAFASWDDAEENEKWKKLSDAVTTTDGLYITYANDIIAAYFHAHSGKKTEDVKFVWGNVEIPYLKSVDAKEDYLYEDSITFSNVDFIAKINSKYPNYIGEKIEILSYTDSGRVNLVKLGKDEVKATELRSILGLRSTNFEIVYDADNVTFKTIGYGHGVGMSQEGANAMAKAGSSCEEIVKYYYSGVEVVKELQMSFFTGASGGGACCA